MADWLIECIESRGLPEFSHPFVQHHSSWVLVYQGLGRIIGDEATERRVLKILLGTDIHEWNWRLESATVAFLLSRSNTAPLGLDRADVTQLVQRTIKDFEDNLRTEYTKFNYAPFLLAGLLRWRLKEPKGLLLGHDPLADQLLSVIERAEQDLRTRSQPSLGLKKRRKKYLPILADLRSELEGEGGNPDLLLNIYGAGD